MATVSSNKIIILVLVATINLTAQVPYVVRIKNKVRDTLYNSLMFDSVSFSSLKVFDSKEKMLRIFPKGKFETKTYLEQPEDEGKPFEVTMKLYKVGKSWFHLLDKSIPAGVTIRDNSIVIDNFKVKIGDSKMIVIFKFPYSYRSAILQTKGVEKIYIPIYKERNAQYPIGSIYILMLNDIVSEIIYDLEM